MRGEEHVPERQQDLSFGIITQRELTWSEHSARIVNVGHDGLRIETRERIEPGYVWFRSGISGNRAGFLEWCMPAGDFHCARIRFVPLSWNVEHYVQERASRSLAHIPLRDPAEFAASNMTAPAAKEASH